MPQIYKRGKSALRSIRVISVQKLGTTADNDKEKKFRNFCEFMYWLIGFTAKSGIFG